MSECNLPQKRYVTADFYPICLDHQLNPQYRFSVVEFRFIVASDTAYRSQVELLGPEKQFRLEKSCGERCGTIHFRTFLFLQI